MLRHSMLTLPSASRASISAASFVWRYGQYHLRREADALTKPFVTEVAAAGQPLSKYR